MKKKQNYKEKKNNTNLFFHQTIISSMNLKRYKGLKRIFVRISLAWNWFFVETPITATKNHFYMISLAYIIFAAYFYNDTWITDYAPTIAQVYWDDFLVSLEFLFLIGCWFITVICYFLFYYNYARFKSVKVTTKEYWALKYYHLIRLDGTNAFIKDFIQNFEKIKIGLDLGIVEELAEPIPDEDEDDDEDKPEEEITYHDSQFEIDRKEVEAKLIESYKALIGFKKKYYWYLVNEEKNQESEVFIEHEGVKRDFILRFVTLQRILIYSKYLPLEKENLPLHGFDNIEITKVLISMFSNDDLYTVLQNQFKDFKNKEIKSKKVNIKKTSFKKY